MVFFMDDKTPKQGMVRIKGVNTTAYRFTNFVRLLLLLKSSIVSELFFSPINNPTSALFVSSKCLSEYVR